MSQTNIPVTKGKLIEQVRLHDHHDPHRHESRLADVILGGQDGLVNVLGESPPRRRTRGLLLRQD